MRHIISRRIYHIYTHFLIHHESLAQMVQWQIISHTTDDDNDDDELINMRDKDRENELARHVQKHACMLEVRARAFTLDTA